MKDKKVLEVLDKDAIRDWGIDERKMKDVTISEINDISQALMEVSRRKMIEASGGCTMCTCAMCTCV
jgi:hypothetical protein